MPETRNDGSQSPSRGLRLIEFLSGYPNGCPLALIAERTGINKSTAHRLLKSLQGHGYVAQTNSNRTQYNAPPHKSSNGAMTASISLRISGVMLHSSAFALASNCSDVSALPMTLVTAGLDTSQLTASSFSGWP